MEPSPSPNLFEKQEYKEDLKFLSPVQLKDLYVWLCQTETIFPKNMKRHVMKACLFIEQHGLCCICERPMRLKKNGNKDAYATFEHVILAKDGGTFKKSNVPLSCGECNGRRADRNFEKFKAYVVEHKAYPPETLSKRTKFKKSLRNGDDDAYTLLLVRRLTTELFVFEIEEGLREKPPGVSIRKLKRQLEVPLKYTANKDVTND